MDKNMPTGEKTAEASTRLERRVVLKGVAWSVPIVAAAIATPLAAASEAVVERAGFFGDPSSSPVGFQQTDTENVLTVVGPATYYVQSGDEGFGDVEVTFTIERVDGGAGAAPRLLIDSISSPGIGPLTVNFRNLAAGNTIMTRFQLPERIEPRTLFPVQFSYFYEATQGALFDALPSWSITATVPFLTDATSTITADAPLSWGADIS